MLVVNIHENHIGWWEHRAGLPCTWPIYVLSEAPWTWLNAKIPTLFDQEKSHGMRLSFFQYSEEHTKTFFPALSYWGWNLRLFIPLLWNSYVHYSVGIQVPLCLCLGFTPLPATKCLVSRPCSLLCVGTVLSTYLNLTQALWHHLLSARFLCLSSGITISYLALYLALFISWKCFQKCGLMLNIGQMNNSWPINYMSPA